MAQSMHSKLEAADKLNLGRLKDEHVIKGKIKQRGVKRSQITKFANKLGAHQLNTVHDFKCAISKLKGLQETVRNLDSEIDSFIVSSDNWEQDDYELECEGMEYYEDRTNEIIIDLESKLEQLLHPQANNNTPNLVGNSNLNGNASNRLKLPHIELPQFDGQPELYEQFIVGFEQCIQKYSLSEFEKFYLLLMQVSGSAKTILNSIRPDEQTYTVAKELLSKAFSDRTCQKFSVIKKLINIKFASGNDSYRWVSEARTLATQVERLRIDGKSLMQYFLWNSLPDYVKAQFMNITNNSKPDVDSILDSAFEVFDRLRELPLDSSMRDSNNVNHVSRNTVALTTTLDKSLHDSGKPKNSSVCALCEYENVSNKSHRIIDCPEYKTAEEKLVVIKKAGGCERCGKLNHCISECKFRFSGKCLKCGKYHAYFLCTVKSDKTPNNGKYTGARKKVPEKKVTVRNFDTNIVEYNVMSVNSNDNIIPTFTVKVGNTKNVRCMYDPAAQITFITRSCLDKVNYSIVDSNFKVNISGFNSSKIMQTELIELKMKLNNNITPHNVRAIVVPEIRTKVNDDIDDIIRGFNDAGIPLADRRLGREYGRTVDILFGVDNVHLLPVHSCSFGHEQITSIYYTCQGVMIAGSLDKLRMNISNLSCVSKFIKDFNNCFK